ncbi:MAG: DUF2793 domain-containing protein, partial [Pontixanthobacter sp.]
AGQTQKEFYVNEAHARIDMLLHPVVEGIADTPPADAQEGQVWLVSAMPEGDWADRADALAGRQAGSWVYIEPRDGLRVYDRAAGHIRFYANGWQHPVLPTSPVGGATVDAEVRAAYAKLIESLQKTGILPMN